MRPLRDGIVAKKVEPNRQLSNGLVIPDSVACEYYGSGMSLATVIAVGPKCTVTPGQMIVLDPMAHLDIDREGTCIIREKEVLGIME